MEESREFSLFEDLEDCNDIIKDSYREKTTPYAKANLCWNCQFYSVEDLISTSIRCSLKLRPRVQFEEENKKWIASCEQFEKYQGNSKKSK